MFLRSQLIEISQRFRPDVEDLQVLLEEEGLPVGSAECVQEFSDRLSSDPRFRRDVAFVVRSMLGRARDEGSEAREPDGPGSMDVLGVLLVAAGGTRQELGARLQQQPIRDLLRFVIQQRRPDGAPVAAAAVEPGALRKVPVTPRFVQPPELGSPAEPVVAPRLPEVSEKRSIAPHAAVPAPLVDRAEGEPYRRRMHAGWFAGALAVLVVAGWLVMRRDGLKIEPRNQAPVATAGSAASPANAAPAVKTRGAVVPPFSASNLHLSKPSAAISSAGRRGVEPAPLPVEMTAAVKTPPKQAERPEPALKGPIFKQTLRPIPVQPVPLHHESAAVSIPNALGRARSAPASTDVSKVFAHPEAVGAAANQTPPPPFRPQDPVLIARNKPAAAAGQPGLQGIVHTGTAGSMASSLMYSPEPEYPSEAIAARVVGQVTVEAVVGPRGNVVDARVVSGPPLLREAALDAVARWRYRPYEQDGKPVTTATTAILDFQILPRR